jgi:hypothetical protein
MHEVLLKGVNGSTMNMSTYLHTGAWLRYVELYPRHNVAGG